MGKALIIKGADFSSIAVDTIEITVGTPTIQIDIYGNVAITSPNGEDIYYTTDDSTPTDQSTKYTAGFTVQNGTTVKAVCYLGGNYSEVVSQLYDGTLQAPVINITSKGVVTITATNNASIRYTVDGQTDPTSASGTQYTEPFNVENGVVVKAIAYLINGSTTISSSVTTSEPAVVVEGIMSGKRFKGMNASDLPNGTHDDSSVYVDDQERFVSPKVYFDAGTSVTWTYTHATYGTDGIVEFNASGKVVSRSNTTAAANTSASRTVTLNASTAYVRFTNKMGSTYYGAKVAGTLNGVANSWTYNASTAE